MAVSFTTNGGGLSIIGNNFNDDPGTAGVAIVNSNLNTGAGTLDINSFHFEGDGVTVQSSTFSSTTGKISIFGFSVLENSIEIDNLTTITTTTGNILLEGSSPTLVDAAITTGGDVTFSASQIIFGGTVIGNGTSTVFLQPNNSPSSFEIGESSGFFTTDVFTRLINIRSLVIGSEESSGEITITGTLVFPFPTTILTPSKGEGGNGTINGAGSNISTLNGLPLQFTAFDIVKSDKN
jgi:hypothetical protein